MDWFGRILELKNQGLNQREIAEILGCDQTNISYHSRRNGIKFPKGAAARDQNGPNNPNYIDGLGRSTVELATRLVVLQSGRCPYTCERCGNVSKDKDQDRHHKDRDRSNNDAENIEVLCATCHMKEHNAQKHRNEYGQFID